MIDFIQAIIQPSYWFTHQSPVPSFWLYFLSTLFALLILAGIITAMLSSRKNFAGPIRRLFERLSVWSWFFGLMGFLLLFFSIQRVAYFSARIIYLLWLIGAILWIIPIIRYAVVDIPKRIEEQKQKREKEKYLPQKHS